MGWYGGFAPYVSVAKRKQNAAKEAAKLKKKGQTVQPIVIEGRTIAKSFWGKAWCEHLESYSDYGNRLPRGRAYVRNGSVLDLKVSAGEISALVSGSRIYKVNIAITKVTAPKWDKIVKECSGKIDSLIELLQGKFSKAVMQIITDPDKGLFPHPAEIKLNCSCPDWADMCKHVAAVLYGVGARLDNRPEELFLLRQSDHVELISKVGATSLIQSKVATTNQISADTDLSTLFGIDIGEMSPVKAKPVKIKSVQETKPLKKPVRKKTLKKVKKSVSKSKAINKKLTPKAKRKTLQVRKLKLQ